MSYRIKKLRRCGQIYTMMAILFLVIGICCMIGAASSYYVQHGGLLAVFTMLGLLMLIASAHAAGEAIRHANLLNNELKYQNYDNRH